jgi:acyl carrier protein
MASVEERVTNIVVDLLGVDAEKVVPEARFREDLEADSLDLVELIMAFEEEFGGEITDDAAQKITSVGEAISYIKTNMGG